MPLPNNPLKALNAYLIKGRERNLLVDTGFNREECRRALLGGLRLLDAPLDQTDIFITHLHADHTGLVSAVATEKNVVYCSGCDAERINWAISPAYWRKNLTYIGAYGFPVRECGEALLQHPGRKYGPDSKHDFSAVGEGDVLEAGDYCFTVVETPGHTPGHLCLYEPDKKILISGDHILGNITPNITMFYKGLPDPLGQYLQSLDKVDRMEIDLLLPGHRGL